MLTLGFDTSNYTTSCALLDGMHGESIRQLLDVPEGALGLRQSDAVFAHIKRLPELSDRLFAFLNGRKPDAIGVSTRPRAVEGSYMPCFLVGVCAARMLASAWNVPLIEVSHQQGHIAAALWSSGRLELLDQPHLAWHLSGGTTELVLAEPERGNLRCRRIGGTTDISAGQLIDRTGKLLGLAFPSGMMLDKLALGAARRDFFRVRIKELQFSLSGVENQVMTYQLKYGEPTETAAYALRTVVRTIYAATAQAVEQYAGLPVVFSGGVASNRMLREEFQGENRIFAAPEYSTDNAMGVAVMAARLCGTS